MSPRRFPAMMSGTLAARKAMTAPDAWCNPPWARQRRKMPAARHARLTASEPGDAAVQPVAFVGAAHVQE